MRLSRILTVTAMVIATSVTSAQALTVTNLDKVPHTLHIEHIGGQMDATSIPPNGIWRYQGPLVWIAVGDGPGLKAIDNNDYTIWPGGKLRIQKYRKYDKDRR